MRIPKVISVKIPGNRVYGLDILRALAILFVMIGHGNKILSDHLPRWIQQALWIDGVSVFFVLSGFLIGKILIKHLIEQGVSGRSIMEFWIRRWFRTIPTYLVVLIALILVEMIGHGTLPSSIARYFTFTQNLITPHPTFYAEAWSLSVEEWFYLSLPVLIFLFDRVLGRSPGSLLYISALVMIAIPLFRYGRTLTIDVETYWQWESLFRKQVITRLDSLMYGVLGAWLTIYHWEFWIGRKRTCFIVGLCLVLFDKLLFVFRKDLGLEFTPYYTVFSFSVFAFGVLLTLPLLSTLRAGSGPVYKLLTRISLISYSMYLIHLSIVRNLMVPYLFNGLSAKDSLLVALLEYASFWLITILGSVLLYNTVEIPTTRWREKFAFTKKESASRT